MHVTAQLCTCSPDVLRRPKVSERWIVPRFEREGKSKTETDAGTVKERGRRPGLLAQSGRVAAELVGMEPAAPLQLDDGAARCGRAHVHQTARGHQLGAAVEENPAELKLWGDARAEGQCAELRCNAERCNQRTGTSGSH